MSQSQYLTKSRINALKIAADNWVKDTGINWDIAACWHLPRSDVVCDIDEVEIKVAGKLLRRYFNVLDKRTFKSRYNKGCRIRRFITLEHSPGVGWHVHGILETPEHVPQQDLITQIKETWEKCVWYGQRVPPTWATWCEPIAGDYQRYITKASFVPAHFGAGTIDLGNTFFG